MTLQPLDRPIMKMTDPSVLLFSQSCHVEGPIIFRDAQDVILYFKYLFEIIKHAGKNSAFKI